MWFLAEQAVIDLTAGMSKEDFESKYSEQRWPDGTFRFGHEPARREEATSAERK